MWECRAQYTDGSTIDVVRLPKPDLTEAEDQYRLEAWLIDKPGKTCLWYSVNWIEEE